MVEEIHVNDLLAAYALGCLEPDEAQAVSEHLATCPLCQAELVSYMQVEEQLAQAVPQTEPPARLKQSLLSRLEKSQLSGTAENAAAAPAPSWW